jgi:hypothetical protein
MEEAKTQNYTFRMTPRMKVEMMQRSLELKKQPAEYIISLIEMDLLSKHDDVPERQKSFIEKQFSSFSEQLLGFMVENIDKKLIKIEGEISSNDIIKNKINYIINKFRDILISERNIERINYRITDAIEKEVAVIIKEIEEKIALSKSQQ